MKHSRIFLGVTTFFLAAAGIVAARANKGSEDAWYYTAPGITHCKAIIAPCIDNPTASVICKTINGIKPYFTNPLCTNLLHYTHL